MPAEIREEDVETLRRPKNWRSTNGDREDRFQWLLLWADVERARETFAQFVTLVQCQPLLRNSGFTAAMSAISLTAQNRLTISGISGARAPALVKPRSLKD